MSIIKIIVENLAYDSEHDYNLGEVVECSIQLAKELIGQGKAREATQKELDEWEAELMRKKMARQAKTEQSEKIDVKKYQYNVSRFWKENPFFYDKICIFWMWDRVKSRYDQIDETDILKKLDWYMNFHGASIPSTIKNNYLEALKRHGRGEIPPDAPIKWIQFRDKAYSINSKKVYDVKPNYFFTNPIPWELGKSTETPQMDKLLEEWVGKDYVKTCHEIMAFCCLRDYPIHRLFCFIGSGRNGKSSFLSLISKFLGQENCTSSELDALIENRFESFKLYKKLLCYVGETNFNILSKTSLLKKLTGQDMIGYEKKLKTPFDGFNYAKIIIASNSLPVSYDTSDGFYRRWMILSFDKEFPEGKNILRTIPPEEYSNLALKCMHILPDLIERGGFSNELSIEGRKAKYIDASNPLMDFVEKHCIKEIDASTNYNEMYLAYIKYLQGRKMRRVRKKEFKEALEEEGYYIDRKYMMDNTGGRTSRWEVFGLILKGGRT